MTKAEVMEIINTPTKHIQIINLDGKASIVYSAQFVELLEAIPEMFTKAIPLSVIEEIKAEIEQEYNRLSATRADETLELGECLGLKMSLKIIEQKVKEHGA